VTLRAGPASLAAAATSLRAINVTEPWREHPAVVDVGRGHRNRERDALPVDEEVVLTARLALVGRVRADGGSPWYGVLAPPRGDGVA
jgi:hypothetical protein